MNMKSFIHDFSAGNIAIKYHLVRAKYTPKRVNWFSAIYLVTSLFLLLLLVRLLTNFEVENSWIFMVTTILILALPLYFLGRIMLQYTIIGELYFHEEHLEIHLGEKVKRLNYKDIVRIEYCGFIPKDLFGGGEMGSRSFEAFKIKFYTGLKESFIVEATNDIFILPEEKEHFRRIHPIIERTLKSVQPRYGTTWTREIRGEKASEL